MIIRNTYTNLKQGVKAKSVGTNILFSNRVIILALTLSKHTG